MNNDFCCLVIPFKLFENFEEAVDHISKQFKKMLKSFDPYAVYWSYFLTLLLPFNISMKIIKDATDKPTIMFSNVRAVNKRVIFNGNEIKGLFFFVPSIGECACGLSISTVGDVMGCGLFSDENSIKDP